MVAAIIENNNQVRRLVSVFAEAAKRNPNRGPEHCKTYDLHRKPQV